MANHFEEVKENGRKLIEFYCDVCDLFFWLCEDEIFGFKDKKCPACGGPVQPTDDGIKP